MLARQLSRVHAYRFVMKRVTISNQIPLIVAYPVEDKVEVNGKYLVYTQQGNPVSQNPYGNITPPLDLTDHRFSVPEDIDIIYDKDMDVTVKVDVGTTNDPRGWIRDVIQPRSKTQVFLIVFVPNYTRVFLGSLGLQGVLYQEILFTSLPQIDGTVQYTFNYDISRQPKSDHYYVIAGIESQISRLELFDKPNDYVFELTY